MPKVRDAYIHGPLNLLFPGKGECELGLTNCIDLK